MKDVALVLCTPDHRRPTARRALDALAATDLRRAELWIVDNLADADFSHPATMERMRRAAGERPLVYLDDDVVVRDADWIDRLLHTAAATGAAIVGCRHVNVDETPNHVGIMVYHDGSTEVLAARPGGVDETPFVPSVSSALVLLARPDRYRFDTGFAKYQHDVDVCLQAWRGGDRVACCPELEVVHVVGDYATTRPEIHACFPRDARTFQRKWGAFASGPLYGIPELAPWRSHSRGRDWVLFYAEASRLQDSQPRRSAAMFRELIRECRRPEQVAGAWWHLYELEGELSHAQECLRLNPDHRKARATVHRSRRMEPCAIREP